MEETNNKVSSKENNNSKKRKNEQENIEDFVDKIHKNHLILNQEETNKFLLICHALISIANEEESSFEEEDRDSVDGAVITLLILAKQILELLEGDINFLEFLKIIKKSLKTLKATLGVFNTVKNNTKSKLKTHGKN